MKIALITLHTPTATNFRGASALPYHLIKYREEDIELEIWSFNNNECSLRQIHETEKSINVKIHTIPADKKMRLLQPAIVRLLLPYPFQYYKSMQKRTIAKVKEYLQSGGKTSITENCVWIYGEDIAHLANKFDGFRRVITTPDCEALYYHRMLAEKGIPTNWKSLLRYGLMYHRYAKMAAKFPKGKNIKYHLVGKEDTTFLKRLNDGIDARFIRHPHYDVEITKTKPLTEDRIKLLIAGRYDIYMSKAVDEAVAGMIDVANKIKDIYHITFLGKNWDKSAQLLQNAGFSVEKKGYVDDYIAEVSSHDIQLTPISVGTGTKGKVLDALANGLMVIGTQRALENIAVKNEESCIQYETKEELVEWLVRLSEYPPIIQMIAKASHDAVLKEHGREKIAKEFFDLFKQD